jgi:hypothetical protein
VIKQPGFTIDYRCENRRKIDELRGDIGAIRYALNSSFRRPRSTPPKMRTVQPGEAFEGTAFKPGFDIIKFQTIKF